MYYAKRITLPANTPATAPVITTVNATQGVIHRVEVGFPSGCSGLVHAVLKYQARQFLPTNIDGTLSADNFVIPINEWFKLDEAPYIITIEAWNLDDTYQHEIDVRIAELRQEDLEPQTGLAAALKTFLRFVGINV